MRYIIDANNLPGNTGDQKELSHFMDFTSSYLKQRWGVDVQTDQS